MVSINVPNGFSEKIEKAVLALGSLLVEKGKELDLPISTLTAVSAILHRRFINVTVGTMVNEPPKVFLDIQIQVLKRMIEDLEEMKK